MPVRSALRTPVPSESTRRCDVNNTQHCPPPPITQVDNALWFTKELPDATEDDVDTETDLHPLALISTNPPPPDR
jgi:hypothetical protein